MSPLPGRDRPDSRRQQSPTHARGSCIAISILIFMLASTAAADGADVIDARLVELGDGRIMISATIRHNDTGWSHYADRFEVLDDDNRVIATRVLMHPHVDEQPFTRSTRAFVRPKNLGEMKVRAHDSRHGFAGKAFDIEPGAPSKAASNRPKNPDGDHGSRARIRYD